MAAHRLASTFTSLIYDQGRKTLIEDDLGNFDLRQIQPNGVIDHLCFRTKNNMPVPNSGLTGQASEIEPDPFAFHVEITQVFQGFSMVYKGTAMINERQEVTNIMGFRRKVPTGVEKTLEPLAQDETTWIVTKP